MIPYDDLVVALTTWRARQGLPVGQMSGALSVPAPVAAPGSGGARTAPPVAPPRAAAAKPAAPAIETHDESLDVDDAALLEEAHYENEGSDFAMAFSGEAPRDESESTAIGNMPLRDSFGGGATLLDSDLDGGATEDSLGGKPPGNKPGW